MKESMNLKIDLRKGEEKMGKVMNRASGTCGTISQVLHIGNCSPRRREKGTGNNI